MLNNVLGPRLAPKIAYLGTFAAALSFYFILSLIPILAVTGTILTLFVPIDIAPQFAYILGQALPPESQLDPMAIVEAAGHFTGQGWLTVSFVIAVVTSWNFMHELVKALHFIFADPEDVIGGTSWLDRLRSLVLLVIWMSALSLTSFFLVHASVVASSLQGAGSLGPVAGLTWMLCAYSFVFIILFGTFWITFRIIPHETPARVRLRDGASFAAAGWLLVCFVFARILPNFWKIGAAYGALGSLIAFLIWANACAWIVLLSACWIARARVEPDPAPTEN